MRNRVLEIKGNSLIAPTSVGIGNVKMQMRRSTASRIAAQTNGIARYYGLPSRNQYSFCRQMSVAGIGGVIAHHDQYVFMTCRLVIIRIGVKSIHNMTS